MDIDNCIETLLKVRPIDEKDLNKICDKIREILIEESNV